MVGLGRVELPTYGLGNRRSIHLSYSPVMRIGLVYIDFKECRRTFRIARINAAAAHLSHFFAVHAHLSLEHGSCPQTIGIDSIHTGDSS